MGIFFQWNIRGLVLKNEKKIWKIKHELEQVHDNTIISIQETHLQNENQIPREWRDYDHRIFSGAPYNDKGSGIILYINKTENLLKSEILIEGRVIYAQIENDLTKDIKNIFAFYGKSQGEKAEKIRLIECIKQKARNDSLKNNYVIGDFNFVTALIDRNK